MHKSFHWLALAVVFSSLVTVGADEADKPDPRIKDFLERKDLKYSMTARGNFQLTYNTPGKRTQIVFVKSGTNKYQNEEYRDITSTAYKVTGELSAKEADDLLADNDTRTIGSWRTVRENGFTYVIYAIQVPADESDQRLYKLLQAAATTADEAEKNKGEKDEF